MRFDGHGHWSVYSESCIRVRIFAMRLIVSVVVLLSVDMHGKNIELGSFLDIALAVHIKCIYHSAIGTEQGQYKVNVR